MPATALRRRRRKLVRNLPPLEQLLRGSLTETWIGFEEFVLVGLAPAVGEFWLSRSYARHGMDSLVVWRKALDRVYGIGF